MIALILKINQKKYSHKYTKENLFYSMEFFGQNVDNHNWEELQKRKEFSRKL